MSGVKQLQKPLQRFKGKPDDKLKAGEPRKSMEALKPVLRRIKEKSPIEAGLNSMDGALSYEGIDNCILSQIIEGDLQNHIPLLVSEKKIRMKDLPLKLKSFKEMDIKEKLNSPKYGKQLSTLVHKSEKNQQVLRLERQLQIANEQIQGMAKREADLLAELKKLEIENEDLKCKLQKYKMINEENRKSLKQKIAVFNQEGAERAQMQRNRQRVVELQSKVKELQLRIQMLADENSELRSDQQKENGLDKSNQLRVKEQNNKEKKSEEKDLKIELATESILQPFGEKMKSECSNSKSLSYLIEGCGSYHYFDQSMAFQKKHKSAENQGQLWNNQEVETLKAEYNTAVEQMQKTYKKLLDDQAEQLQAQQKEIYQQGKEINRLNQRLEEYGYAAGEQRLSTSDSREMLMLVNDKAKWGIIVQGKDYEIEDLKERLLSCELIMSRLRTELQIQKQKKMVADGNEIFELHLAQLNMIHQMEKLKEKMKCEQEKYEQLKRESDKKEELIKKFSARRKLSYEH